VVVLRLRYPLIPVCCAAATYWEKVRAERVGHESEVVTEPQLLVGQDAWRNCRVDTVEVDAIQSSGIAGVDLPFPNPRQDDLIK
jgi:hypothetical protein